MKKNGAFFILLLGVGLINGPAVNAQEIVDADTSVIDTIEQADTVDLLQREHDPRKAWQYSAIIPGLGQAYNKKYWKIPIVYAAGAAAYYYYRESALNYHTLHDAYVENANFGSVSLEAREQLHEREYIRSVDAQFEVSSLENEMFFQQKHMERAIVVMFAVYFANILDALVDGYFFSYDVEQELAYDFKPGLWQGPDIQSTTPTLTFRITF